MVERKAKNERAMGRVRKGLGGIGPAAAGTGQNCEFPHYYQVLLITVQDSRNRTIHKPR